MKTLLSITIFILLSFVSLQAQTLQDSNIVFQSNMWWYTSTTLDPSARLFSDYINAGWFAYPSTQKARALRQSVSYVYPKATGYIYEFQVTGNRPPSIFGLHTQKCESNQSLDTICSNIYWRESTATPGAYRLSPAATAENPNPPSFSASPGDRFAIEWADGPQAQGRFNFYKNRTLVFSLTQTLPSVDTHPFDPTEHFTFQITFDASSMTQEITLTKEIYFQQ